ncbi:hypothetical protein [Thalassomonas sp. M1454]|uniref:hypothetical protein n=1 Tax=Thalassomonas sp. M1454 TaxID=2594477 RepID=UPI001180EE02|nr:hypothetical protein [Thalassomonas sp. M1454]TRX55725.1 hypothetical protein FNN08_08840 [Thalassomonas sp. M1454]
MSEAIAILATLILIWMMWRLYQAKQYNAFIDWLRLDIAEKVAADLEAKLIEQRSPENPNNQAHIEATQLFYQQAPVRIFEYAVTHQIISSQWLEKKSNKRHASHLLFVQSQFRTSHCKNLLPPE